MNKLIGYNLAKLLKKKKYNEFSYHYFDNENFPRDSRDFGSNYPDIQCYRPTIADVCVWLYEKHNKFISVINEPNIHNFKWVITNLSLVGYQRYIHSNKLKEMNEEETEFLYQHYFKTPTECYEKAIEYTLTKLI